MTGPTIFRCLFAVIAFDLLRMSSVVGVVIADDSATKPVDFVRDIQPLLRTHCVKCHGETTAKGGLRLDVKTAALAGGDSGAVIKARQSEQSFLLERISSRGDDKMPPEGTPLSEDEVQRFKRWIDQGAAWPDGVDGTTLTDRYDWWSLKPLMRPDVPQLTWPGHPEQPPASPIDAFILAKLREKGLQPSPEADRQTLARRLYFDLIGLPPTPEEIQAFVSDPDPNAYVRLVDQLLDSPHYGERWARHWLDVVHYGDTHGYDKDQPRPHAWPYRDYVVRAFNNDKPYSRFVEEQLAGDVVAPGTEDGVTATGFIAAGPWDFIGHAEVPETKTDGMIARMLDRDDMVTNTCNTFLSLTVQCARCHNHKFDPIVQDDYYRLQAVFAALDRADRPYDVDLPIGEQRAALIARRKQLQENKRQFEATLAELGGEALQELDRQIMAAGQHDNHPLAAQFGYHSQIEPTADVTKWIQVDLGDVKSPTSIQLVGCHDDFNQIGAGFGFPVRFKIELSNDEQFQGPVSLIANLTAKDVANPGVKPLRFSTVGQSGRFVRVTVTKLAPRQNDFIFALAELSVFDEAGKNVAAGRPVRGLDSIEAAPRWSQTNLVDSYYVGVKAHSDKSLDELNSERDTLVRTIMDRESLATRDEESKQLTDVTNSLANLPSPSMVYAGTIHTGSGAFTGTGHQGGKPRVIHVLARGDVTRPLRVVGPGTVPLQRNSSGEFANSPELSEGQQRLVLAQWITATENPLTWRSIVNRVWLYHFGRGIVDSPNDFGRMGQRPSHPELLDWLATEFRDGEQSLKQLHRMIVTSATYRQNSTGSGAPSGPTIDSGNVFLWRMNRRKLEAEAVRDAVLVIAGKLNRQLGGPAFKDFVVEKPEHSPHYEYQLHDPEDARIHRRSIYRFLVRSQPQPFMTTLDCADPSMSVDKRNETVTALQALALLNNRLMLTMAKEMSRRVEQEQAGLSDQVEWAFRLALSRSPTAEERAELTTYAEAHGLVSVCRLLMNLNEFLFVD